MEEKQKWLRLDVDDGWQIVVPNFDNKPHAIILEGQTKAELADANCPCKPKIDWIDKIIIHNSFIDKEKIDKSLLESFN